MINIIFDECISIHLVSKIKEIVKYHPTKVTIHHLQDYYKQGIKDQVWLSKLDDNWLIITADRGINSKKEDKLPLICKQKGIRCLILTPGYIKRKQFYKAIGILYCWDEILKLLTMPKGSQYKLRLTTQLKPKIETKL